MRGLNIIALLLPITIGGCVGTAVDLAMMPIKGASKVIGQAAESKSEAHRRKSRAAQGTS